jgi:hypothetical protein
MKSVASRAIGHNPIGLAQAAQEAWSAYMHYDIVLPKAGGENAIKGDFLARDMGAFGNAAGIWSIVRVR